MTIAETLVVAAVLAQILWTFGVMAAAGLARRRALSDGTAPATARLSPFGWPERVQKISNNMNNQFETPTLFYALALLGLHLKAAGLAFALLAWAYVASRILHSFIHAGPNVFALRGPAFAAGVAALMGLTLLLVLHLLVGRLA